MGLGRFFDEENIVKKTPTPPIQEEVKVEPIPEPKPEKIKRTRKKKEEIVEAQEVAQEAVQEEIVDDKQLKYQQVINQVEVEQMIDFPNREQDLQNMLDKVYKPPTIPVYNVSRDMSTGRVKVEARKSEEVLPAAPKKSVDITLTPPKKQQVKNLLEKCEQEIIRIGIEIEVGLALIKMESDGKMQSLYETKLTALKSDLDYQQKRRLILERMLQGD